VRFNFDGSLQLKVICVKNNIRLPLFVHITRLPKCGELHRKCLEWVNICKCHAFQHILGNKGNEDQEPAKLKLVALIMCLAIV
jgi:hypothetical protein